MDLRDFLSRQMGKGDEKEVNHHNWQEEEFLWENPVRPFVILGRSFCGFYVGLSIVREKTSRKDFGRVEAVERHLIRKGQRHSTKFNLT